LDVRKDFSIRQSWWVRADHELRRGVVDVGDVGLEPSQATDFGLQLTVHALVAAGQLDELVPFDRDLSRDRLLRLGDLLEPLKSGFGLEG
jgi:hypothetical protein